jgi:hypothetical protein
MQTKRQEFKRNKTNIHQKLKKEQEKSEFSKWHQKDREREREDNYSNHDNYISKCRFFDNRKSSKLVFSKYHLRTVNLQKKISSKVHQTERILKRNIIKSNTLWMDLLEALQAILEHLNGDPEFFTLVFVRVSQKNTMSSMGENLSFGCTGLLKT